MLIEIPDYVLNLVANSEIKMILPSHRRMAEPIMIFVKIRFQHRLSHTHTNTLTHVGLHIRRRTICILSILYLAKHK